MPHATTTWDTKRLAPLRGVHCLIYLYSLDLSTIYHKVEKSLVVGARSMLILPEILSSDIPDLSLYTHSKVFHLSMGDLASIAKLDRSHLMLVPVLLSYICIGFLNIERYMPCVPVQFHLR